MMFFLVEAGQRRESVGLPDALFLQQLLVGSVSVNHRHMGKLFAEHPASVRSLFR